MPFRDDSRAQSVQIGAILLFAVLIILFAIYQGVLVPAQNREVEFNHNQRVQGDMVDVRNAILSTRATGQDGYTTVRLGTEYPGRLIGLNPSPPSGSLSTTAERPIVVEVGGSDVTDDVCPGTEGGTRMLQYNPTYAEYSGAGTLRYDNSLLYHNFSDGTFLLTDQRLVEDDTVSIVPLNRTVSAGGSQTVSVETRAGPVNTTTLTDPNITLPTRLSIDRWEDALASEVPESEISDSSGASGRNVTLELTGEYTIECSPVGFGQTPYPGPRNESTDDQGSPGPDDINLVDVEKNGQDVTLNFTNEAGTVNLTAGRINHYEWTGQGGGSNVPSSATVVADGTTRASLDAPGSFESFTPKIPMYEETSRDIVFTFDREPEEGDKFVLTLEFDTGETAQFFVTVSQ